MALTAKQEMFAKLIALEGMNQSEAYAKAYDTSGWKPASVASKASTMASDASVAARIVVLKERATDAAVRKTAITLADSIAEAGEMLEGAKAAGQYSAGVAAAKLRAQLAGHLVERKEVRQGPLDDTDVAKLMKMKADAEASIAALREASELAGEVPATPPPMRRVIGA